jgi:D-hexose-6-phosphate mutarotase
MTRPPIGDPFSPNSPRRAPSPATPRGSYGCPHCGYPTHGNAKQTPAHGIYRMRDGRQQETDEPCPGQGEKPTKN